MIWKILVVCNFVHNFHAHRREQNLTRTFYLKDTGIWSLMNLYPRFWWPSSFCSKMLWENIKYKIWNEKCGKYLKYSWRRLCSGGDEDPAAYLWKDQNPGKETLHKLVRIPQYLQPPNPPLSHHTNGAKITFTANCPFIWNPELKIKSTIHSLFH